MKKPSLDEFAIRTFDKLRYRDTDRQGHVNNVVFATFLETGRVEVLYDNENPLAEADCAFVIARLTLDFTGEINWPGRVDIGTQVSAISRSSVTLEQGLFQDERLVAKAQTVIVQMNESTRRSHPLSTQATAWLSSFMPTSAQQDA